MADLFKKMVAAAFGASALAMVAVAPAQAQDGLSCSDLDDAIDMLDEVSMETFFRDRIRAGSDMDDALEAIIGVSAIIAMVEDDGRIAQSVDDLAEAWDDEDWDEYSDALDDISDRLSRFYDRDC
ncbi:hypothetical protein [Polycladidibacter hongkongensis]|uniref:hypothetical protein n=1 Tax=Polycladidibacter hongkongensis TaxID=1647556 RepID=UPI0008350AA8|nr:hypothetical protein [Pseudovibrio hongkongensis]